MAIHNSLLPPYSRFSKSTVTLVNYRRYLRVIVIISNMVANDKPTGTLRYEEKPVYTTSNGCPIMDPESSQRVGQNGPLLLQDFHLIDLLAHFDRERIPERVVHAKGAGAYGRSSRNRLSFLSKRFAGEFEVTHDISDLVCLMPSWKISKFND